MNMSVRIETLAELKSIRFDKNETVFCVQNGREYYLELDGGSFTPDDIDFVQAIHGVNARYIAISGSTSGHSSTIASQTDAESGIENTKPMTALRTKQAVTAYGELSANKGRPNGYPSLDSSSRIPLAQLPTSVQTLKGNWNASTNTPTLADGTGTSGDTYRVSEAATRNLGSGNISFGVDDRVVYNGTTWEKWDTNDAVTSVHGRTGGVTAQAGDYAAYYGAVKTYITSQATPSRVTGSAPTALGQYRSYLRNAGARTYTETNGSPTTAPSSTNGYKLYNGNAFASADTNNEPSKYEIYIGTGKTPSFEFYKNTGRTGLISTDIFPNWGGVYDVGCATGYDPVTGVAFVTIIQNGKECAPGVDENGVVVAADIYFDIKC
jgi:hypothetical protein